MRKFYIIFVFFLTSISLIGCIVDEPTCEIERISGYFNISQPAHQPWDGNISEDYLWAMFNRDVWRWSFQPAIAVMFKWMNEGRNVPEIDLSRLGIDLGTFQGDNGRPGHPPPLINGLRNPYWHFQGVIVYSTRPSIWEEQIQDFSFEAFFWTVRKLEAMPFIYYARPIMLSRMLLDWW